MFWVETGFAILCTMYKEWYTKQLPSFDFSRAHEFELLTIEVERSLTQARRLHIHHDDIAEWVQAKGRDLLFRALFVHG